VPRPNPDFGGGDRAGCRERGPLVVAYFVARGNDFSGRFSLVNGDHRVPFCRLGMVWAVVSMGARDSVETLGRGWRRIRTHRRGIADSLLAYVEITDGRVSISKDVMRLDQTERSTMSNWYGLAFTRLTAARLLGIAWLRYVDSQRQMGIVSSATASRKRGDLVGLDYRGEWHVLESKGRYGFVEKGLERTAKGQATNVLVNHRPPATASSCVLRLHADPVHATLSDPEEPGDTKRTLEVSVPNMLVEYYAPYAKLIEAGHSSETVYLG